MPPFPIIDAHVHLWDPTRFRMSWLDNIDMLNGPFNVEDYRAHTQGLAIEAMVYVEVAVELVYALLEARWAEQYAQEEPRLRGIVAAAPVEYGERVRAYLEALVEIGPRIKGVRRLLQDEHDPYFCMRPDFISGVQLLADFGLSFDIGIRHEQLPGIIELVRRCPQTAFILDHIAKPNIKGGELDPWRTLLRELAALPNIVCKISGMVTEADHDEWTVGDLEPYVAHVLDVFGEDRIIFGSDWPVVLLASSYERWVQALDDLTSMLPWEVRRKLWVENAHRLYRLHNEV